MNRFIRLVSLLSALFCFILVPSSLLSAQSDTLKIGDTVDDVPEEADYLLDAQEGQTITLRWEGDFTQQLGDHLQTDVTDADGVAIPLMDMLQTLTSYAQVYVLAGTGPYHISAANFYEGLSLHVLEGDTISRSEQPALNFGKKVSVSVPEDDQLLVFPLDVQAGDVFTVNLEHDFSAGAISTIADTATIVRDANGHLMPPQDIYTGKAAYVVTGDLPYRLEFAAFGPAVLGGTFSYYTGEIPALPYSVWIEKGNSVVLDGGVVEPGDQQAGRMASGKPLVFTLDSGDSPTITVRLQMPNGGFTPYLDDSSGTQIFESFRVTHPAGGNANFYVAVYSLTASPPYRFHFVPQTEDLAGDYKLLFEVGDTLERHEAGRLAPGGTVQGVVPQTDDAVDYVILDVDPTSTVTLNWNQPGTQYYVLDAGGNFMFEQNDSYTNGFAVYDLSEGTAPFIVSLDDPGNAGQPFTFTLAEGRDPLPVDGAGTANTAGDTATSTGDNSGAETSATAVSCSVSASKNVNERSGPGTNFDVAGTLAGGTSADADGQTTGADGKTWYRLTDGGWVRSDLVNAAEDCLDVAEVTP